MFWGALTGRMKPKLTTYCRIIVIPMMLMPGVWTLCSTEMMIGIIAAARALALAKPRWMMIRKAARTARMTSAGATCRLNIDTMAVASQAAALVASRAVPRLMPTPKRMSVPQGILDWASFQLMTPMLGSSM